MDAFNLERFVAAQAPVYAQVLGELQRGRKTSHWMWFIFPQLVSLGRSETARFFGIASLAEASAYLVHSLLGARLVECTAAVIAHAGASAETIFGAIDAMKLRSSMTLFEQVPAAPDCFGSCLDLFFGGARDGRTLELLSQAAP